MGEFAAYFLTRKSSQITDPSEPDVMKPKEGVGKLYSGVWRKWVEIH